MAWKLLMSWPKKTMNRRGKAKIQEANNHMNFSLPLENYEQLISEHCQDNHSEREDSPMSPTLPPAKRTRTSKREMSPSSTGDSVTSTPEPEEGKPSRRRGTKKLEATPEPPSGRHHSSGSSSNRRAGRSSGTTRGSGAKRQTSKRK
ncbi:unnamed protein product [Rhizopus stolonifer]